MFKVYYYFWNKLFKLFFIFVVLLFIRLVGIMRISFAILLLFLWGLYGANGLNLIAPLNNEPCQDQNVTFVWAPVTGALSYSIKVSAYSDLSNPILDSSGIATTQVQKTVPGYNVRYYWQVKAIISLTPLQIDSSQIWSFTTITSPPILSEPSSNATCQPLTLTFRWSNVTNGTSYRVQISTTSSFASTVKDTNVNGVSASIKVPNYNTKYYWRVSAQTTEGCTTRWSAIDSFKTNRMPPALVSPSNGQSGLYGNITFQWNVNPTAQQYVIQITTDSTFAVVIDESIVTSTSTTKTVNFENQVVFWRVKAVYSDCETDWSEVWRFRTMYGAPTLSQPPNDTTCVSNTVDFRWSSVNGSTKYRIQVAEDVFNASQLIVDSLITSATFKYYFPKSLQSYSWRVRAEDTANTGLWSDTFDFQTTYAAPKHLGPSNGAQTPIEVVFKWSVDYPLSYFHIQVSTAADFRDFRDYVFDIKDLTKDSIVLRMPNYFKKYYWRVSVSNINCKSDWSTPTEFTTILFPPTLKYPQNNSTKMPLSFTCEWEKPTGAEQYDFQLSKNMQFSPLAYGRVGLNTTSLELRDLEPTTTYYWRVKAKNSEGESQWSAVFSFTTSSNPLQIPTLISPMNNSIEQPVNSYFVWSSVPRATYYELQLSEVPNFSSLYKSFKNITDTAYFVPDLQNNKEYFWRVQAYNDSTSSAWSTVWRFVTQPPAPTQAVQLLSPAKEHTGAGISLTLSWSAVPFAYYYHLQLSKEENFANNAIVIDDSAVTTNSRFVSDLEYNTTYYWHVRAYNSAGSTAWSEVWWFKTIITSVEDGKDIHSIPMLVVFDPLAQQIVIKFIDSKLPLPNVKIELFDVNAKIVYQSKHESLANTTSIPAANFTSGVYFLKVTLNNSTSIEPIQLVK